MVGYFTDMIWRIHFFGSHVVLLIWMALGFQDRAIATVEAYRPEDRADELGRCKEIVGV